MTAKFELVELKSLGDERGDMIAVAMGSNCPFEIRRAYYIFSTKKGVTRGFHAHKNLKQIAISLSGSCTFILDDGDQREIVELNRPDQGLLIEGLIWREMKDFSEDCILLVLASEHYDESDYVREYEKFRQLSRVENNK